MKVLLVRWRDCSTNTGVFEMDAAAARDLILVETVGHLVGEHDDRISLASEYFETEKTCRHLFTIPRVNIEEVIEMEHGKHMKGMSPKGHGPKMMSGGKKRTTAKHKAGAKKKGR